MAKPKKRTKGRRKSKAALATEEARREREGTNATSDGEAVEFKGSGGMMTKMRGGFQNAVGSETGEQKGGWLNTALWIAVIGAGAFFIVSQYR